MSPLLTRPNIGYPDWQRITDWDGPIVYSEIGLVVAGPVVSGVIPVGRFGYLAGSIGSSSGIGNVLFEWYADAAATILVGRRIMVLNSLIPSSAQLRLPNMGSYLVITLGTVTVSNWTFSGSVLLTNRYHPCELIPIREYVMANTQFVNGGTSLGYFPNEYYSGPMRIQGHFDTGHYDVRLISVDSSNVLITHDWTPVQTITPFVYDTIAPIGYWYLVALEYSGVGGTLTLTCTHSLTGST